MALASFSHSIKVLGIQQFKLDGGEVPFGEIASQYASYVQYHRSISRLQKSLVAGTPLSKAAQQQIIRAATESEQSLGSALDACMDVLDANGGLLSGVQKLCATNFDDVRVCSNPSLQRKAVRDAAAETTINWDELTRYHGVVFGDANSPAVQQCLTGLDFPAATKQVRTWLRQRTLPEFERDLRQRNIITVQDNPVPVIVGAAAVVVGVVVIVASGGVAAGVIPGVIAIASGTASAGATVGGAIAMAGVTLLATEAYKAATGDHDPNWDITVKFNGKFDMKAADLGIIYGNMSPYSMEAHVASCDWLRKTNRRHVQPYRTLAEAHDAGLDNCAFCIGGSTR